MIMTLNFNTEGEKLYEITSEIKSSFKSMIANVDSEKNCGLLTIFTPHTSCALTISEAFEDSAKTDVETFLKKIAPRNQSFINHVTEGEDDSPSHMKSVLLQPDMTLIVDNGELVLGTWQGIFLAEFRDAPKQRKVFLKFLN